MYFISEVDYFRDFNMMLNEEIIDCFSEKPPEKGVISQINEVIKKTCSIGDCDIKCNNRLDIINTDTTNKKLYKNIIDNHNYTNKDYERTKYPKYDKRIKKNGNYENSRNRNSITINKH